MPAKRKDRMSLAEVAASGDRRALLEAQRDRLAQELQLAAPAYMAGISRELRAVTAELEGLATPERSVSDDLAERRARRIAGTARGDDASGAAGPS